MTAVRRPASPLDDARRRERLDPGAMGARIEAFPDQIREGTVLAEEAARRLTGTRPRRIVLFGMGGSAIAGDLLRVLADREGAGAVHVIRHYEPPAWLEEEDLLVFSSYSGETEETLSAFQATRAFGARACAITTGGRLAAGAREAGLPTVLLPAGHPPRAALGYSFAALASLAARSGLMPALERSLRDALPLVEAVVSGCRPAVLQSRNSAKKLAIRLAGRAVVVIGGERSLAPAALRWKGQLNENAKHLAWASPLPEMNHNEVDGFVNPKAALGRLAAVLLRDPEDHPRIVRRFDWLAAHLKRRGLAVLEVRPEGEEALGRLLGCVALGDFVSYYVAILNRADPSALPGVESLKKALQA